jgi:hypothetical protein
VICDLFDNGFVEDGAFDGRHRKPNRGGRGFAPRPRPAEPEFNFGPDRPVGLALQFLLPVFDSVIRDAVLRSPRTEHAKLGKQMLERGETPFHVFTPSPALPQAHKLLEGGDVRHREIKAASDGPVRAHLSVAGLPGVLLGKVLVGLLFSIALRDELEAGNPGKGLRKVRNTARDFEDNDPLRRKTARIIAQR